MLGASERSPVLELLFLAPERRESVYRDAPRDTAIPVSNRFP